MGVSYDGRDLILYENVGTTNAGDIDLSVAKTDVIIIENVSDLTAADFVLEQADII